MPVRSFHPRKAAPSSRGPWLPRIAAMMLGLGAVIVIATHRFNHSDPRPVAAAAPGHPITIVDTGQTWSGDPLFRLTNRTHHTLRHVVIQTWRNTLLPVYAIAQPNRLGMPTAASEPFPAPPLTWPPNAALWFVGSRGVRHPPYTVMWQSQGLEQYATVIAP